MAWISVHESVDGPKLRNLYKLLNCSKFEAIGILNFLWLWGLSNAEKDGLIRYVDREDLERYFYGVGAGCKLGSDTIVSALLETGWIDDTPSGMYLHDWEVWQEQWYKAKERREADARRKREARHQASQQGDKQSDSPQDSPAETPKTDAEKVASKKSEQESKYGYDFEEFWSVYPKKIGKGEAYKCYKARRNDGFSSEELKSAAMAYADQCVRQRTEKQYIKHPKTFLSTTLPFLDYIKRENSEDSAASADPFSDFSIPEDYREV